MPQYFEAIDKNPVVLIDAYATWCGPCKAIAPVVAKSVPIPLSSPLPHTNLN